MASIVSKFARAAASKGRPAAASASKGRPAAAIRVSSPPGGPMSSSSEEEEKAMPKSEISWANNPGLLEARLAAPSCICPQGGPEAPLYVDEAALESDEAMWAFYERWCEFHGISRTRREMELRFKGFSEGARAVYRASAVGERKWMNPFADMTRKEAARRFGGRRPRRK